MRYELAFLDLPPSPMFAGDGELQKVKQEWVQPIDRWTIIYYHHTNAFTVNTQTYGVEDGDFAIFPPGSACSHARVGPGCSFDSFTFGLPANKGNKLAIPHLVPGQKRQCEAMRRASNRVIDLREATSAFVWQFLWDVAEAPTMLRNHPVLYQAEAYIRNHLGQGLLLRDLAKICETSERQLLRAFREQYGITYQEYVQRLKAQEAARLLLQTDMAIKEVAIRLGFFDLQHFNKFVRAATGLPPRAYRERAQGAEID